MGFDLNVPLGSDGCENPNNDPGHNLHAGEFDIANEDSTKSLEIVDHPNAIEKRLEMGSVLKLALNVAEIGVSRACNFMEKESGGPRKDACARMMSKEIVMKDENGDANSLLRFFMDKSKEDPFFYWDVQLDDDGRLMNFFFRDSRCAIDYEFFGDVLSLDTTYCANKYNLICAPFVGINHQRRNVVFGLSFLSNETTDSFEWLFKTFLKSMNGKEPQVICSDQRRSLINGVDYIFRTASHHLCRWQINQNAPSHFGSLDGDSTFKKMWYRCMTGCESSEEFECTWWDMVRTYDLSKNRWFTTMYHLRKRWASVFTNKRFSAGLHATLCSEAINKVLKDLCTSSNSLYEFIILCDQIQTDWRTRESVDDALCSGVARQFVKHNRFLVRASKVYTHAVYKCFESEVLHTLNVNMIQTPSDYSVDDLEFLVTSNGPSTRLRRVFFNKVTNHASCSCHMWEAEGIFCRHILSVYFFMNVKRLPEQSILRRWSKNAKIRMLENLSSQSRSHGRDFVTDMVYVNQMMRMTYNMAQESNNHAECRSLIVQRLGDLLNELTAKKRDVPVANRDCGCFRDMLLYKRRGYSNNRLRRRHWDECQNRGKKKARGDLSGRPLTLNNNTEATNCTGKTTEIDAIRNKAFYVTQNSSRGYGASGR